MTDDQKILQVENAFDDRAQCYRYEAGDNDHYDKYMGFDHPVNHDNDGDDDELVLARIDEANHWIEHHDPTVCILIVPGTSSDTVRGMLAQMIEDLDHMREKAT